MVHIGKPKSCSGCDDLILTLTCFILHFHFQTNLVEPPQEFCAVQPSMKPSVQPSLQPSMKPSVQPSLQPSTLPSRVPSYMPSGLPTGPGGSPPNPSHSIPTPSPTAEQTPQPVCSLGCRTGAFGKGSWISICVPLLSPIKLYCFEQCVPDSLVFLGSCLLPDD